MNYNLAKFKFAAGNASQLPKSNLPEIVFSGRSNVGKSSLINKILNRKSIARVSSSPGKTATINFFDVDKCLFVDLPGYGYAKVSYEEKKRWSNLIESYFNTSRNIGLVIQIVDIRHEPSADDIDMINYLIEKKLPFIIALTKKDKLKPTELKKQLEYFTNLFDETEIKFIPISSLKGDGIEEIKNVIESYC